MTTVHKDAFGVEVNVGDYLVYATKSQYASFGMGLVTKLTNTSVSMLTVEPNGQTIPLMIKRYEAALPEARKRYEENKLKYSGDAWVERRNPDRKGNGLVKPKRLDSVSTCYRVPAVAVPPEVIQLLNG